MLTTTGGGTAIHLVRQMEPGVPGQAAVPDRFLDSERMSQVPAMENYDRAALLEPRWADTTMCGREWAFMIGGEGGSIGLYGSVAYAPTCQRCLALMDRLFPHPIADSRLPLVAQLVTDMVVQHGYAEVRDVPGDQQTALRKEIRSQVRKRTGHSIQTVLRGHMIFVVCEPIHAMHAQERSKAVAEAVADLVAGHGAPLPAAEPEWRISWNTWAA